MEKAYNLAIGKVNPKKPFDAFKVHLWVLEKIGQWAPETDNRRTQLLYTIWSFFYRGFFLYTYTFTQLMFFKDIKEIQVMAEVGFLLLTQITLLYKVEKFYANRHRIRACAKILNSSLFQPQNPEEDAVIKKSMILTFILLLGFVVPAFFTITNWAITPFLEEKWRLPILAWYPFSTENPIVFALIYFYQIFGIYMSATFNCSTDTFASSMIMHVNGQVKRLGIQLKKIGYDVDGKDPGLELKLLKAHSNEISTQLKLKNKQRDDDVDEQMREINSKVDELKRKHGENYGEVVRCIIYHEYILQFCAEIQDIFGGPIFAQIMASSIIICMTLILMIGQLDNIPVLAGSAFAGITFVMQILLFCFVGNEVMYSSNRLTEEAYFSNFPSFDKKASKALIIFMQRTHKNINVMAGTIFRINLSLATFMAIMKSSYSYFAVLRSMQEEK